MGWNASVGIPLILVGIALLVLIYVFGRPKRPGQGKRTLFQRGSGERVEPTMGDGAAPTHDELESGLNDELNRLGNAISANRDEARPAAATAEKKAPAAGARSGDAQAIERIVTLFVAARAGETIPGSNLVVAAEKAGLTFGDMGIFHRLVSGKPASGPVFSMANMVNPGNFDMRHIDELRTPGVTFFMALPAPMPALDAWDIMLPTVQRLAELLDANVLDEERNTLGRQTIAHIRDELRAWDRKQERNQIKLR